MLDPYPLQIHLALVGASLCVLHKPPNRLPISLPRVPGNSNRGVQAPSLDGHIRGGTQLASRPRVMVTGPLEHMR